MLFQYNDGGRKAAGFTGSAGDCVTRAIAIAAELPYREVYDAMAEGNANQRQTKRMQKTGAGKRTARDGIYTKRKWFKDYMREQGFVWVPLNFIGSSEKKHLIPEDVPQGRLIASVSKHYTAIIDGVINDTFSPARGGERMLYGYWVKS